MQSIPHWDDTIRVPPAARPAFAGIAFADGDFRPIADAKISILDWGLARSDVVFDVMHVIAGKFFVLDRHLDRFFASCAKTRLSLPVDRKGVAAIAAECVRRAGLRDAYVQILCTRGMAPDGSRDPAACVPHFMAYAIPFFHIATEEQRARGMHLAISPVQRIPATSIDPTAKNFNRLDFVMALFEGSARGADTVVLPDGDGNITDGPAFNVFAVKDGVAVTPEAGVLHGITRSVVLDLCRELQIRARTAPLPIAELRGADEVFLTSTAGGVFPVTRVDRQAVGSGAVGPITRRLADFYWQKHDDPAWTTAILD